ncbi:MAG: hypothetical protein H7258_05375 [Ferruginibacter sp.]|nr:hypothetical protein [Ferruginibacter sp.]
MPFVKRNRGGAAGGANAETFLVINPATANGDTGKRLPANVVIKRILVKAAADVPTFKMGTVINGDDLCYETLLPAGIVQPFAPFAVTKAITPVFVSGMTGTVVSIIIFYQPFNL